MLMCLQSSSYLHTRWCLRVSSMSSNWRLLNLLDVLGISREFELMNNQRTKAKYFSVEDSFVTTNKSLKLSAPREEIYRWSETSAMWKNSIVQALKKVLMNINVHILKIRRD